MRIRITMTIEVDPNRWAEVRGSNVHRNLIDARADVKLALCEHLDTYLRETGIGKVSKVHD